MRVTQSMMMGSYTNSLNKIIGNMNTASLKVQSQRKFLTASEDPASAARTYQLRRNMQKNDDYLNTTLDIIDTLDSLHESMLVLSDMATSSYTNLLTGMNGTWTVDERSIMANDIKTMMRSSVDALNSKFGDTFMFGGSSTKELPFQLTETSGGFKLTYRGLDVTDTDPAVQAQLQELANEKIYRDIGFGLTVNVNPTTGKPEVVDSSAFNTSIPGISFLGFGTDPSDNFILNLGKIAAALEKDPVDQTDLQGYADKLKVQQQNILNAVTRVDSQASFLKHRQTVLEQNNDNLNNKLLSVEYMDMEEAISIFKMAEYTYNASLQMGTKMLTPSFIDFMN